MKITLIENSYGIIAFGTRTLAAYLKGEGHEVSLVFLPGGVEALVEGADYVYRIEPQVLDGISEISKGADLVGISLMSNYVDKAVQITETIRRDLGIPVIWGGIHPSVKPDECLEHADMVCVGEGEEALAEVVSRLADGQSASDVANIWTKTEGRTVRNPPRPQMTDLSRLPYPDYTFDEHYIHDPAQGRIVPLTPRNAERFFLRSTHPDMLGAPHYTTMFTRGCPYHCSYCCNNALRKIYPRQKPIRWRSVAHLIGELREVTKALPFVKMIYFNDDEFYSTPPATIREFAEAYRREIGLPFYCLVNPRNFDEGKTRLLADAGLIKLEMGIQSASPATMKLFQRDYYDVDRLRRAVNGIHCFTDRILPDYDIILDNPFDTTEDVLTTFRFMLEVPEPYEMRLFSLVFFPGTDLHRMALESAQVSDETRDIYRKHFHALRPTYLNLLFHLHAFKFPRPLLAAMAAAPLVNALEREELSSVMDTLSRLGVRLRLSEAIKKFHPRIGPNTRVIFRSGFRNKVRSFFAADPQKNEM